MTRRRSRARTAAGTIALALGCAIIASLAAGPALAVEPSASGPANEGGGGSVAKLRGGLDRLVAHPELLDPRIPDLLAGYVAGEIPYIALLREPNDAAHRHALRERGARIVRSYRSAPMVALASRPADVLDVAALPWVRWMVPVEVVVGLDHEREIDQSDPPVGTSVDLAVPSLWDAGATGRGVRIAILDTGMDLLHQDLDDLDFRHWANPPGSPTLSEPKVVGARNFNGGVCALPGSGGFDLHGHGTHVAGIAAGTGEGDPTTDSDDGRVLGIAPDAKLAVGKVLTDAGAGLNSDLIAAFEWAAMPAGSGPLTCPSVGAHIVNTSLGTDARPLRLNTGHDVDAVSHVLDRLATRYGTIFVSAAGNSGPYVGSVLEAPGAAAQAMSVSATAKDWDVNHDETASGDTCAGYDHPVDPPDPDDNTCDQGPGTQPTSISTFSSRGYAEGRYQKPDVSAPGYNVVSAQATTGVALAQNDLNPNTRTDPFYATATGTSMASPATAGAAALLLDGYRDAHGSRPRGPSGIPGIKAPTYALVRAALMNTARTRLRESRWILTTDDGTADALPGCPELGDPIVPVLCDFKDIIAGSLLGSLTLQDVRNGPQDPFVGPLAEGAGRIQPAAALRALRDGVVVYSAAQRRDVIDEPLHQDFQGSWQAGLVIPGSEKTDRFVLRSAPGASTVSASFAFVSGAPSDTTRAIPTSGPGAWEIGLPARTVVPGGGSRTVSFTVRAPAGTPAGIHTGQVLVRLSDGARIRIPMIAAVPMHDPDDSEGNPPGARARFATSDVFAKGDTVWPSAAGVALGSMADWVVLPVLLPSGLDRARFTVYDAAAGDETYDLYLYGRGYALEASTHPFLADGVTDVPANDARGPTPQSVPQVLEIDAPAAGRHYVVVHRSRIGAADPIGGDFGAFVLTLDEIAAPTTP